MGFLQGSFIIIIIIKTLISGKRPSLAAGEEVLALQAEVAQCEEELGSLKQRLAAALSAGQESARLVPVSPLPPRAALSGEEIRGYSRQLVLPELGVQGQLCLAAAAMPIMPAGAVPGRGRRRPPGPRGLRCGRSEQPALPGAARGGPGQPGQGLFGGRRPVPPQFGGGVRALRPGADAGHGAGPRPPL